MTDRANAGSYVTTLSLEALVHRTGKHLQAGLWPVKVTSRAKPEAAGKASANPNAGIHLGESGPRLGWPPTCGPPLARAGLGPHLPAVS